MSRVTSSVKPKPGIMLLVDRVAGSSAPSEPPSPDLPSGLGVLATSISAISRHKITARHVPGSVFCEECGADLAESGPRCECCDRELGGECGW